jgi:hypothetical protein
VLDTLHALGTCRTLLRLLSSAGFSEELGGQGPPLTLFAPSDAAFAAIEGGASALLDPPRDEMLIDLLEYHLVRGRLDLGAALAAGGVRTVHGAELHVRADSGEIWGDAARVHGEGIACTNGVVYLVDAVLAPALSEGQAWIAARTIGAAKPSAWDARTRPRGSFAAFDDLVPPAHLDAHAGVANQVDAPDPALHRSNAPAVEAPRLPQLSREIVPIHLLPA